MVPQIPVQYRQVVEAVGVVMMVLSEMSTSEVPGMGGMGDCLLIATLMIEPTDLSIQIQLNRMIRMPPGQLVIGIAVYDHGLSSFAIPCFRLASHRPTRSRDMMCPRDRSVQVSAPHSLQQLPEAPDVARLHSDRMRCDV